MCKHQVRQYLFWVDWTTGLPYYVQGELEPSTPHGVKTDHAAAFLTKTTQVASYEDSP